MRVSQVRQCLPGSWFTGGLHNWMRKCSRHRNAANYPLVQHCIGFARRGLLEKGSFQKSSFSRDSRKFRDSRDSREPPDCGKQRRLRPFSRASREFSNSRDSRGSSSDKTPFVMTPSSGPDLYVVGEICKASGHIWMVSPHGHANISRHSIAKKPAVGHSCKVREVQSRKSPNFDTKKALSCPRFLEDFLCFVPWETETTEISKNQERKRHININNFFRWLPGWGGGFSRPGGQGSNVYVRNPRNINIFDGVLGREDRWPGWPRNCLCVKLYVPFLAPTKTPGILRQVPSQVRRRNITKRIWRCNSWRLPQEDCSTGEHAPETEAAARKGLEIATSGYSSRLLALTRTWRSVPSLPLFVRQAPTTDLFNNPEG